MAAPTKVELSVEMTCDGCVRAVRNVLDTLPGVKSVEINLDKEQVIVESSVPSSKLVEVIESTGKRAVLTGYGSAKASKNLGAAVALIEAGNRLIQGVVRFVQSDDRVCVIEGTIDGLTPGNHAVCVHELGDLSSGCDSCGDVFPGLNGDSDQSYGEIVDVTAEENGRAVFRVEKTNFSVWDVIGRSMVIHQGNLEFLRSKGQGNSRLACGIIARSAGVFENSKKICACDGVSLWDERNVPVAGPARQSKLS